jgi:hypothetical protein
VTKPDVSEQRIASVFRIEYLARQESSAIFREVYCSFFNPEIEAIYSAETSGRL